jgi:hypothetical protein
LVAVNREDIYDHLAQVYLGKRKEVDEKKKKQFNAWLVINIVITLLIFASATYGLTAFLRQKGSVLGNNIIYSLHRGAIRLEYNFKHPFPPEKTFSLAVPPMDAAQYAHLQFSIRGREEGVPGTVKILIKNKKNEEAFFYVQNVGMDWQEVNISLEDFKGITDWTTLTDVSFVLENWNVEDKKGLVLIEDVRFST